MYFGFKTQKTRQFNYKPMFWDKESEERAARRRAVLGADAEEGDYKPGSLIREGQLRRTQTANRAQRQSKVTMMRGAIFIVLLFGMLYMLTDFFGML